ncbi:MAG: hypothetical protein ACLR17_02600 [Enterobacteriaceae bacterium]
MEGDAADPACAQTLRQLECLGDFSPAVGYAGFRLLPHGGIHHGVKASDDSTPTLAAKSDNWAFFGRDARHPFCAVR